MPTTDGARTEISATDGQRSWGQFHLATVMFLRAIQLRAGARPRVVTGGHKFVQVALREVIAGTITWESGHAAETVAVEEG
jgi:hypothetical protein